MRTHCAHCLATALLHGRDLSCLQSIQTHSTVYCMGIGG